MKNLPMKAKSIDQKTVHTFVTCFRHNSMALDQLKGELPSQRLTHNYTFLNSDVDFCGPFHITYNHNRKGVYSKVHVNIYICMSTKVIHLEIVSDLTAAAFIAALRRFCAGRGKVNTLTSNNATNFKGA